MPCHAIFEKENKLLGEEKAPIPKKKKKNHKGKKGRNMERERERERERTNIENLVLVWFTLH
jgi:hypothetical protein